MLKNSKNYEATLIACFLGYIVQAIVNNFAPLLFLTFQKTYGIPLSQITLLVTFNFGLQLLIDLLSAKFADKIGYRLSAILSDVFSTAGLFLMTVLPDLTPVPFTGLLFSVTLYAVGGGLLEVVISPMVEACPTKNKEAAMSMLHSFYCWGQVAVVLLSTVFFHFCGIGSWRILGRLWALVPLCNMILFFFVPIASLIPEGETRTPIRTIFRMKLFWIMFATMVSAGACEQAVSQWASAFAEKGLGVSKTLGDLLGPMTFAAAMGASRLYYGKRGDRIDLIRFMTGCGILCILSYALIAFSRIPVLGLLGCTLAGLSVGILWPGSYSIAAASPLRNGGTALFAFLALGGDLGCTSGPTFVGFVSTAAGDNLKAGIGAAEVFPLLLLFCLFLIVRYRKTSA